MNFTFTGVRVGDLLTESDSYENGLMRRDEDLRICFSDELAGIVKKTIS